ncbi:MAG: S8 family serine peptidase [Armatimonadetes bacterium]|nr:S8 family serine peptidase [Armatimonadota bacterium]
MNFRKGVSRLQAVVLFLGIVIGTVMAIVPVTAGAEYAPGELLVQFKDGATENMRQNVLRRISARITERVYTRAMRAQGTPGLECVSISLPVEEALRRLGQHPSVAFAEPNWILRHQQASNDPYYTGGSLWGMYGDGTSPRNQYGSQAGEAWAAGHTGSSAICVGVIDTGIDASHPDLAANIWTNPNDPVDGYDNDANGYVDDNHGWDFYHNDNTIYDPGDGDEHGTHVAGTIGGKGGNGAGVAGVNWSVTIISAKFLGPDGGYVSDAVKALDYLTDLKKRHALPIVATNNSWGGGGYSQALHGAIIRAAKQGILFVAAAGNSGVNNDRRASYPSNYNTLQGTSTESAASYDAVIAVAAIDKNGNRPWWSSYGPKTVDLGAPGVSIVSTTPGNTYSSFSGTSMATPYVTGGIALYASTHPGTSAAAIRKAILDRVVYTSSLNRKTVTNGRLNVGAF